MKCMHGISAREPRDPSCRQYLKMKKIHELAYECMIAQPFISSVWLQQFMGPTSEHGVHASAMQASHASKALGAAAASFLALSKARRNESGTALFEVTREPRDETSVYATDPRQKCSCQKDRKNMSYEGLSLSTAPEIWNLFLIPGKGTRGKETSRFLS